uniref:Polyprenyldihydroxybenzoate methyltransferase n=1 Tax=Attheya septentrionalis TaxID=420275 RepID=A0A7S2UR62_9STRA|mmetsp:Transcript_6570/g.11781  ORF Transcript_6570/g.11781 Transcript_6570/m.11781 type:complete len:356 (+) Transcript_6570:286-1353(+)
MSMLVNTTFRTVVRRTCRSSRPIISCQRILPAATTNETMMIQRRHASSTSSETTSSSSRSLSVASEEVTKFSSMAGTWWDSRQNPLVGMNPIRVQYMVELLGQQRQQQQQHHPKKTNATGSQNTTNESIMTASSELSPLQGLRALDVGCGGGLLSESLARLGASVTSVDPSIDVARAAMEHSRHDKRTSTIDYRGGISVEDLAHEIMSLQNDSDNNNNNALLFDVVCILEVIEHATDPHSLIEAAASLLKRPTDEDPGGILFVSTINRTAKSFAIAIVGAEHVTRMVPVGTHSWDTFRSPQEVQVIVEAASSSPGLVQVDVCGMVIKPPFLDMSWRLDPNDTDVNWIGAYQHKKV